MVLTIASKHYAYLKIWLQREYGVFWAYIRQLKTSLLWYAIKLSVVIFKVESVPLWLYLPTYKLLLWCNEK